MVESITFQDDQLKVLEKLFQKCEIIITPCNGNTNISVLSCPCCFASMDIHADEMDDEIRKILSTMAVPNTAYQYFKVHDDYIKSIFVHNKDCYINQVNEMRNTLQNILKESEERRITGKDE